MGKGKCYVNVVFSVVNNMKNEIILRRSFSCDDDGHIFIACRELKLNFIKNWLLLNNMFNI